METMTEAVLAPKHVKRILSHVGAGRWLDEVGNAFCTIKRIGSIPSPYASGPTHKVYIYRERFCILVETAHKQYDVFDVNALVCEGGTGMSHTPEPWYVKRVALGAKGQSFAVVIYGNGRMISDFGRGIRAEVEAQRIVACVNGCVGLNPAAYHEVVEALHYLLDPLEHPADAIARLKIALAHAEGRTK